VASLQRRDWLQDPLNAVIQQIQGGVLQAQNMIQGVQNQTAGVTAAVTAGLQARAAQLANFTGCAATQGPVLANITAQAGMLLHQLYYIVVTATVNSDECGSENSASVWNCTVLCLGNRL
jgi:hypothetical protein